jgi:hypothetical protein
MIKVRGEANPAARSLQQWPLLVVVAGVVLGLLIAVLGDNTWRIGCLVIGSALCVGAVERIALPRRDAGLLEVRGKAFDIAVLALGGVAIITLAIWVHGR